MGRVEMSRRVKFRKKKSNRFGMVLVFLLVTMFCSVIVIKGIGLQNKRDEYNKRIEALEHQIEDQKERTKELEEYEKYTKTDKYVEEIAKEKLGLVYEDQIIFKSSVQGGN